MKHELPDLSLATRLTAARAKLAGLRLSVSGLRIGILLGKANFNPNQPRFPRGQRDGGRWSRDGSSGVPSNENKPELRTNEEREPELAEQRPASARARYLYARQVAEWLLTQGIEPSLSLFQASHWVHEHAAAIKSYLDRPKSLAELQRAAQQPRSGYEIHHIVEQDQARRDGFRESLIQGEDNLVLVPSFRHRAITGWFMRANDRFGGVSPREFLKGKSWEYRQQVGLNALRDFEVLNDEE